MANLMEALVAERAILAERLSAIDACIAAYREAPPATLGARVLAALPRPADPRPRDGLSPRHRLVLDAVDRLRAAGRTRIRGDDIAAESGVPVNSLRYIVRKLIERGFIDAAAIGWQRGRGARREPGRRFTEHLPARPEEVTGLALDHPALTEGRTLFPSRVIEPEASPRLLVGGQNSRKIGDRVVKGAWAGMPIFVLTLEERATCPASCGHWSTCYGNSMPRARRHRAGPALEARLLAELAEKQREHRRGFVVRLHQLGDFYSVDYVQFWRSALVKFAALHCFGYTAWQPDTEIGAAVARLRDAQWDRFAIRTSSETSGKCDAVTIWRQPEGPRVAEGIVCPAQTDATSCCGSCGLCWAAAAKDETIVFVAHGRRLGGLPHALAREAAE
jgi:hypothetical protein